MGTGQNVGDQVHHPSELFPIWLALLDGESLEFAANVVRISAQYEKTIGHLDGSMDIMRDHNYRMRRDLALVPEQSMSNGVGSPLSARPGH